MDISSEFVGVTRAAEIASVHTGSIRKAIARKDLPAVKFGREWIVSRAALDTWINDPEMHKTGVKK